MSSSGLPCIVVTIPLEFVETGKVGDGAKAEVLQELLGRSVLDWPAGRFLLADFLDELALEEEADHSVRRDAADGLDLGARYWLGIGHDR